MLLAFDVVEAILDERQPEEMDVAWADARISSRVRGTFRAEKRALASWREHRLRIQLDDSDE
jgi:hypothetical protein